MLRAAVGADAATRAAVDTMFRPSLDRATDCVRPRRAMARVFAADPAFAGLGGADAILALLLIKDCNSHDLSRVAGRPAAGLFARRPRPGERRRRTDGGGTRARRRSWAASSPTRARPTAATGSRPAAGSRTRSSDRCARARA